ncbi:MAG: uracil-DNA glycosylase [Alphaproteobacteria bacterium]|nr:uracil-DNA glycosylase [Alphaproteobacteria bacterium]
MTITQDSCRELAATLSWQIEAGADEAILDEPIDRLANPPPEPATGASSQEEPGAPVALSTPGPSTQMTRPNLAPADKVNDTARTLANACPDLTTLQAALAGFDGCTLKTTATNLVFGAGMPDADIMLIGDAPGRDEDQEGVPFVGASGQLLDAMLSFLDLGRDTNVYITNILPWRPPGNRQPTGAEIAACLPFLERHIALVAPRLLVFLGGTSAKTLLNRTEGITRLRGQWYEYNSPATEILNLAPIPAMATLHPAYLLRQPAQKRAAWLDLIAIREKLEDFSIADEN